MRTLTEIGFMAAHPGADPQSKNKHSTNIPSAFEHENGREVDFSKKPPYRGKGKVLATI